MADTDLAEAFKLTPSLVEQLDKALAELESRKDDALSTISFTEITKHFHDLEEKMTLKYAELEAKEKEFTQMQSDAYKSLEAREAAVAAKEHDMINRIQVLKDAAVAALTESRPNDDSVSPSIDTSEKKVISSLDETNVRPKEVTFLQELSEYCEQMDTLGLLSFLTKNLKNVSVLYEELTDALKSSHDPGCLVLNSLDGFYPHPPDGNKDSAALQGTRQSCITLMEAMNAMLAKADVGQDIILSNENKQRAKAIADEWWPKLAGDGVLDAANGKSLEAEAFLQLLATFRIVSEFEEDHLCKLVLAVSGRRRAPELCRSLGLAHKMPGVVSDLIGKGKLLSAVHFIHAFELVETFPTVPLLMTYLKDLRRKGQAKRIKAPNSESVQYELNSQELEAVKDVIYCVEKYNLKAEYPLEPLHRRVGQLERAQPDRRRPRDSTNRPPPHSRKRGYESTNRPPHNRRNRRGGDGFHGHRGGRHSAAPFFMDRRPYGGPPQESYPQVNPYIYPPALPPSQPAYSQPVYDQNAYYYPPVDAAAAAAPAAAAAAPPHVYSGYATSSAPTSYQPYM